MNMTRRTLMKAGATAIVPAYAIAPEEADAELLQLGRDFEAAWEAEEAERLTARETDDWDAWEVCYASTEAIARRIETVPATTLAGFRVKARAIQWCYGDDPVNLAIQDTVDQRIANRIVTELLALN